MYICICIYIYTHTYINYVCPMAFPIFAWFQSFNFGVFRLDGASLRAICPLDEVMETRRISRRLHHQKWNNSYWTWPFIVDLPIKNGDLPIKNCDLPIKNGDVPIKIVIFHSFLYVYQRVNYGWLLLKCGLLTYCTWFIGYILAINMFWPTAGITINHDSGACFSICQLFPWSSKRCCRHPRAPCVVWG